MYSQVFRVIPRLRGISDRTKITNHINIHRKGRIMYRFTCGLLGDESSFCTNYAVFKSCYGGDPS